MAGSGFLLREACYGIDGFLQPPRLPQTKDFRSKKGRLGVQSARSPGQRSSFSEDDSPLREGLSTPRKQTVQARRICGSRDDLVVGLTSPKCQLQIVLQGVPVDVPSIR